MHQRQAGSYARRFYFGKRLDELMAGIDAAPGVRSVGLIPQEFDDLQGGEIEIVENATRMSKHEQWRE